jgi:hypothetical protein
MTSRRWMSWFPIVVALFLPLLRAMGQGVIHIDGRPSCAACRIELVQVAVLAPPDDAESVGLGSPVVHSSDGRWATLNAFPNANRILVFAPDGKFLRQLGASGRGPGEFTRIAALTFGPGDTLYAWDQGRLAVFAPNLAFVRNEPWTDRIYSGLARPNGSFVVRAVIRAGASLGSPVHVVTPAQGIVRSYGSADKSVLPACDNTCNVNMNPGVAGDEVIVNAHNRYSWTVWGDDGKLRGDYVVDSPWFKYWTQSPGNWIAGEVPPPPILSRVSHDTIGRIWTSASRAPANWVRRPLPAGLTAFAGGVGSKDRAAMNDFMMKQMDDREVVIEVVDLKSRRVVASQVFPGSIGLPEWPYVSRLRERDTGELEIVISRLVLTDR